MNIHVVFVCNVCNGRNFIKPIDCLGLARLGNADGRWLRKMHVARSANGSCETAGGEFAIMAAHRNQFCAAGKKLRRIALVGVDVCQLGAINFYKYRRSEEHTSELKSLMRT